MPTQTQIQQTPISSYLIGDRDAPTVFKNALCQYDNYQIYDLYCLDLVSDVLLNTWDIRRITVPGVYFQDYLIKTVEQETNQITKATELLAVQRYDPSGIDFDFEAFAINYHSPSISSYKTGASSDPGIIVDGSLPREGLTLQYVGGNAVTATIIHIRYAPIGTNAPPPAPYYIDFLSGYFLDTRLKPGLISFVSPVTEKVKISYYQVNNLEGIPNLRSIDWVSYEIDLIKDRNYTINFSEIVFCTMKISVEEVQVQISSILVDSDYYPLAYYFVGSDGDLFGEWMQLRQLTESVIVPPRSPQDEVSSLALYPNYPEWFYQDPSTNFVIFSYGEYTPKPSILRKIAANNNLWNNDYFPSQTDINFDPNHDLFRVDNQRAYYWHINPLGIDPNTLEDIGIGSLTMNSPLMIMIGYALDVHKYALDPETGEPRIANLGHLVEQTASLLGYRPEPDGSLNVEGEKQLTKEIIHYKTAVDKTKIGANSFGQDGMLIKRVNNRRDKLKIVSDKCVIIRDLPQLIGEYFEQQCLALGIQESSAIDIQVDGKIAQYNSQLEILTDILCLLSATNKMTRSTLISSLTTQAQSSETIAALGLPSVTKTIPVKIDKNNHQIPYKGVAPHRSISQEIAACTNNVGIVMGHLI